MRIRVHNILVPKALILMMHERCRSKATVDAGTPQIKGFRLSVQHQNFEVKRVTNGYKSVRLLRRRVILVPTRALDPCRALAKRIRALGTRMAGKALKTNTQLET